MFGPSAIFPPTGARRAGWRAALLFLFTALFPMPAIVGFDMSRDTLVICTADGPVPRCAPMRWIQPTLPPPMVTFLAPAPIVTTAHFIAIDSPSPAHAMPRGSLAARAANLDLTQP